MGDVRSEVDYPLSSSGEEGPRLCAHRILYVIPEIAEFDPPDGSLRRSVRRGAIATGFSQAVQIGTQIASVLILSRLLAPSDFGLMAMIAPVVALLGMLQDFGLVQATVQKIGLKRSEVNFLFWVNIAASAGMAIVLVAMSGFVAMFYGEPKAAHLTAAMAAPMILGAVGAQHMALLNRRMEFGRIALITVAAAISTLAATIAWAMYSPSYWALFAGSLIGAAITTISAWSLSGWRPGWPRSVDGAQSLLGFGAGITGFNFANFFARNADNVLIGRFWGEAQLGFYDRAYKLLLFPLSQISNPLAKVMIPALSRMVAEPDRYRHAFFRVLNLSLLVSLPGVAFAIAMSDVLIPFVLGEQWLPSASIFMALGFAGLMQPLNNPAGWLFISQGRSTEFMIWGLITAAIAVTSFVAGLRWGALGVAVAYAISEYIKTPLLWLYISRRGPIRVSEVAVFCGPSVLAAHVALLAAFLTHDIAANLGLVGIAAAGSLSYVVFVLILFVFPAGRATLTEARALALLPLSRWLKNTA